MRHVPVLYVHEDIYDEFITSLVEKTKKLKLGNPFDKGTHVGAIIDQGQLDVVIAMFNQLLKMVQKFWLVVR